jgi:hypothetical protein
MMWLGPYTPDNVAHLKTQMKQQGRIETYHLKNGSPRRLKIPDRADGILFGCIGGGGPGSREKFFATWAKYGETEVLVPTPLPLNRKRHMDGQGIFEYPDISDKAAGTLLDDLMEINPESRGKLGPIEAAYKQSSARKNPQMDNNSAPETRGSE